MTEQIYIKTVADARKCIGQKLYWDDVGSRYIFLRNGTLEEVFGRNIRMGDGDYKRIKDLPGLRNFPMGGAWKRHKETP